MMKARTFALSLLVGIAALPMGAQAAGQSYKLGPQDRLRIRVLDWRTPTGDAHEWKALSGTFTVNAAGNVSLPLVGDVPAEGETTTEFGDRIAERLKAAVGLSQKPVASVEIKEYRPFYVLGRVTTPGAYPYRPNLTAVEALSVAGGMFRGLARGGNEADLISRRGDLRLFDADKVGLLVRRARLDAELSNAKQVTFPPDIAKLSNDPKVARLMKEEQLLFDVREQAFASQIASMNATKEMLLKEVDVLKAKGVSLAHQSDLAKKELQNVNSLVSKGLAVSARQLSVEQNAAQFESAQLDVSLSILRAQQDASKIDRDMADLRGRQKSDALTELGKVQERLSEIGEKMQTTAALIDETGMDSTKTQADLMRPNQPTFWITRHSDGKVSTFEVRADDPVLPGDVLEVKSSDGDNVTEADPANASAFNASTNSSDSRDASSR